MHVQHEVSADSMIINGQRIPGIARLRGFPRLKSGGVDPPGLIEVDFILSTEEEDAEFARVTHAIGMRNQTDDKKTFAIEHGKLNARGIRSVAVVELSFSRTPYPVLMTVMMISASNAA